MGGVGEGGREGGRGGVSLSGAVTFFCRHPQLDRLASEERARALLASASDDGQPCRRLAYDFIFGLVYYPVRR